MPCFSLKRVTFSQVYFQNLNIFPFQILQKGWQSIVGLFRGENQRYSVVFCRFFYQTQNIICIFARDSLQISEFCFLIFFVLLPYFFSPFLHLFVLFIRHCRVSQEIPIDVVVVLERTLQSAPIISFEKARSIHPAPFPASLVYVSVLPHKLTISVIVAFLKLPLVNGIIFHPQNSITIFLILFPVSLPSKQEYFISAVFNLFRLVDVDSKTVFDEFGFRIGGHLCVFRGMDKASLIKIANFAVVVGAIFELVTLPGILIHFFDLLAHF